MDEVANLIARIHKARESVLELGPGKTVTVRRPPEAEMSSMRYGITLDHVCKYVVDWSGFTEADLLGANQAAAVPVPFHESLWCVVVTDNVEWAGLTKKKLADVVSEYLAQRAELAKNSQPSSTHSAPAATSGRAMTKSKRQPTTSGSRSAPGTS